MGTGGRNGIFGAAWSADHGTWKRPGRPQTKFHLRYRTPTMMTSHERNENETLHARTQESTHEGRHERTLQNCCATSGSIYRETLKRQMVSDSTVHGMAMCWGYVLDTPYRTAFALEPGPHDHGSSTLTPLRGLAMRWCARHGFAHGSAMRNEDPSSLKSRIQSTHRKGVSLMPCALTSYQMKHECQSLVGPYHHHGVELSLVSRSLVFGLHILVTSAGEHASGAILRACRFGAFL